MLGKSFGSLESVVNPLTLESNTLFPLFLLMFKIFNYNFHNCSINSGASVNVMTLSIAKKIKEKWEKIDAQIIQLDRSLVQEIRELNNVIIFFIRS